VRIAVGAAATLLLSAPAAVAFQPPDVWTQWAATPTDTWIRSLDFTSVGTLVASSGDGDGVYQAATATGPWAQTNGGLTTPGDLSVYQVIASGGKLYAASSGGLFTAPQGGGAWTQLGGGIGADELNMGGIESVVVNSPSSIVVAVSGAAGPGVYTSSDSGGTWTRAGGMPAGENIFHLASPGGPVIYAAGDSGVWTSVNGGSSWTLTSDGINTASTTFRVAVGPAPNEVWAASGSDVYKSTDGGVTWINVDGSGDTALPGAQLKAAFLLAPSLQTSDVIVGTSDGVWASPDGGTSWGQMSTDSAAAPGEFGTRAVYALGVGFTPPSLLAGTQGFGVYSLPVTAVSAGVVPTLDETSGLTPGDSIGATAHWLGTLPVFTTYTWKRCQGSSCSAVGQGPDFIVPNADANSSYTYEVQACAINLLTPFPVCSTSGKTTGGVQPIPGSAPVPLSGGIQSSISPDPNISYPWGQTFTIDPGQWGTENAPGVQTGTTVYNFQWQRCDQSSVCTAIPGATQASYTTTAQDVGDTVLGSVAVGSFFGSTPSQFYEAGQTFTIIEKTPVNTAAPKIVGAPYVGQTLQSTAGAWSAHDPTYTRRWLECAASGLDCNPLNADQTGDTYTVTSADLGSRLVLEVTATQADPSQNRVAAADSAPSAVITNPPGGPGGPGGGGGKPPVIKISGPHKLGTGAKLHGPATVAGYTAVAYQWFRNGKPIKHAVHGTYKLSKHDLGQRISLRITLRSAGGAIVVVTSNAIKIPKAKHHQRKRHKHHRKR
jgi:hypothetical protein